MEPPPALTIFCTLCRVGLAVVVRIPDVCPACEQETIWTIWWPEPHDPSFPFVVTVDDRKFLHSIDIQTDEG